MKYIVSIIFFCVTIQSIGQAKVWMRFGDEALQEGDYYGASQLYLKAWSEDSLYKDLVYKLALAYKGYHYNSKAIEFFKRIELDKTLQMDHLDYLFHLAELYKSEGDYEGAKKYYQKYTRVNKDARSFKYLKTKNELKNYNKIIELLKDTLDVNIENLGPEINTGVAEYYPVWINDSVILYSALKAKNTSPEGLIEDKHYGVKIFLGAQKKGVWKTIQPIQGAFLKDVSYTDGCFDAAGNFYFARKNNFEKYQLCKSKLILNDSTKKWGMDSIVSIRFSDETEQYNFRNPFILEDNNKRYLLFSSDKKGGKGGMDIWYVEEIRKKWSTPKNLGLKINTPGNEVGPFYHISTKQFYFASDWHYGLGGYDIFEVNGNWKTPSSVTNLGVPVNTKANDLYYAPLDSLNGMLTSTRQGAQTDKEAVCCNDLFYYQYPKPKKDSLMLSFEKDSVRNRLQHLLKKFHVTLYFHNDRPNPDSWDTLTPYDYFQTYDAYMDSIPTYQLKNTYRKTSKDSIMALNKINGFFSDYVFKGANDLKQFLKELLQELEGGQKIILTVKGYASPLAKSDYNVHLSLRRIHTLQNYLRKYSEGAFIKYLDETAENGGVLRIKKEPFGENRADSTVSDNYYNTKLSVYSKEASLERKIEIVKLELIEDLIPKDQFTVDLDSLETRFNLGLLDTNQFEWRFNLQNNSSETIFITATELSCHCLSTKRKKWKLESGETEPLDVKFDLKGYKGKLGRRVTLNMSDGTKRYITILMEIPN